jgi:hypothetical protein
LDSYSASRDSSGDLPRVHLMAAAIDADTQLMCKGWEGVYVKPHSPGRYLACKEPAFEEKAAALAGLSVNPSHQAALFCAYQNNAIRPLDRLDGRLPLSPSSAERHRFEYNRSGTLCLLPSMTAAPTGEVVGQAPARLTTVEFVAFLEEAVAGRAVHQPAHTILDCLSDHKASLALAVLAQARNVVFLFTPSGSSWRNKFAIFTSLEDMRRNIMRYIRLYEKTAGPFQWKYTDFRHPVPAW